MNNFFSTTNTSEVSEIKAELLEQGFLELEPCGEDSNLLIDRINKTFWICNNKCMENNKSIIEGHHKEQIQQATLKIIQSWEN